MFNIFKGVVETFIPVLNESQFYKNGVLTPEEFVESGDLFISKCANWRWAPTTSDTPNNKPYLPPTKQYLITEGVTCFKRASDDQIANVEDLISAGEGNSEDWVVTHTNHIVKEDSCPDMDDFDPDADFDDEEEEQFDDIHDANTFNPATNGDSGHKMRLYTMTIVYDRYFRTPRVFMQGYDAAGQSLSWDEVKEDISTDHANKTVTLETHPHTDLPCLSIHPCQHAHTMIRMLEIMVEEEEKIVRAENEELKNLLVKEEANNAEAKLLFSHLNKGKENDKDIVVKALTENEIPDAAWLRVKEKMPVNKYLLLFLKFVATVIPTIDYDNTANISLF